jgi:NitT/TauT family transport system substrate-binding protein
MTRGSINSRNIKEAIMWRTLALAARHTNGVLVTAKKFHDANPKICGAVVAAFEQANAFIKAHPREAAQIYPTATRDKNALDALEKMAADPDVDYTTTPVSVMKIVDFMYSVGRIKKKPASWKDMFFRGLRPERQLSGRS